MSYDIYIGNAELRSEWPGEYGPVAEWSVGGHAEPDAPTFPNDGMTENGNSRHPGYTQWAEFCRSTRLYELFYGVERQSSGILSRHPGCVPLTEDMHAVVRAARIEWQSAHPNAEPGWDWDPHFHPKDQQDDGVRGRDGILARLLWLDWWMNWTLRNCERPAVSNT